jgi:hypothetical protein
MLKVKRLHPDAKLPTVAHPGGVQETDDLGDTKRGTGGFGSTGA